MAKSTLASMSKEQVLKIALTAVKILLVSGAETYRVEDTMLRICREGGMTTIAAFCTPSLIMIGEETMEGASLMYRVTHRGTDLTLISEVNDMSFHMPTWGKSFQDTMAILEEKTMRKPRPAREEIFWSGLAGAFFAVVLGGGPLEFLAALLGSLLSMAFVKAVSPFRPSSFWETTMAGAIICLTVVLFRMACPDLVMELAIAGGVMPYLPGMAFTNGIRDFMAGDLLSGTCRAGEAIFLVGGVAIGIATVLGILYL